MSSPDGTDGLMPASDSGLSEGAPRPDVFSLDAEYARCIQLLERTGITTVLPVSERVGIIGFDDAEYPLPTLEELRVFFDRNKELVGVKIAQGFTRLQLTPIAMSLTDLTKITEKELVRQAGRIILTYPDSYSRNEPARIAEFPVFVPSDVLNADQTGTLLYFPSSFELYDDRGGLTKAQLIQNASLCAVPGWSIGLIEDTTQTPRVEKNRCGRKPLAIGKFPQTQLEALRDPEYRGETGWTPEDFLIEFITRVEQTGRTTYAESAWLIGSLAEYIKNVIEVPVGKWDTVLGSNIPKPHRLSLDTRNSERNHPDLGVPTMVRLTA